MPDQTLAQLVKAKFPGVYDAIPDAELEAKVIAQYPGVYDSVPRTTAAAQPEPAKPSTWSDKIGLNTPTPPGTPIRAGLKGTAAGLVDYAQGIGSGVASTVYGAADIANKVHEVTGGPVVKFDQAKRDALTTAPDTFTGKLGKGVEMVSELAVPVGRVADALPSTTRAAGNFEKVMGAARNVPVDVSKPGDVALRVAELAQRGGGTNWGPGPVRQLIQYLTDPKKPQMTYEVGRDFASNISRLSAKDVASIPPAMMREIGNLRVALNQSLLDAAATVGKGPEYVAAMKEFAQAKRFQSAVESAVNAAKGRLGYAGAAGAGAAAGTWLSGHLKSLLGE